MRGIRLTRDEFVRLLEIIEQRGGKQSGANRAKRHHARERCFRSVALVQIHKNGPVSQIALPVSDVSAGGVGLLHRAMMHLGTRCTLYILLDNGTRFQATGAVVRCEHVEGLVHEIGIQFDQPVEELSRRGAAPSGDAAAPTESARSPFGDAAPVPPPASSPGHSKPAPA